MRSFSWPGHSIVSMRKVGNAHLSAGAHSGDHITVASGNPSWVA